MRFVEFLGILAFVAIVIGALIWAMKYAQDIKWEGYHKSIKLGDDCLSRAKLAATATQRLDEAMRCAEMHPGTVRTDAILQLQHEAIQEMAKAKSSSH